QRGVHLAVRDVGAVSARVHGELLAALRVLAELLERNPAAGRLGLDQLRRLLHVHRPERLVVPEARESLATPHERSEAADPGHDLLPGLRILAHHPRELEEPHRVVEIHVSRLLPLREAHALRLLVLPLRLELDVGTVRSVLEPHLTALLGMRAEHAALRVDPVERAGVAALGISRAAEEAAEPVPA